MPRTMDVVRSDRVLVVRTVEDHMTVEHKVWEKQLDVRGYDPNSWLVYEENYGSPTRGSRVATLCIRRGSSASCTPLPFYLIATERLLPWSASCALMDYKVPARAFIKKSIKKGCNSLFPKYVGHIERKPVYKMSGPLEYMDNTIIPTDRGVREVTTEEWGGLKVYPSSWGTTPKDRRRIIREPSLHFWSVLGDAFAPTLIHQEEPNLRHNGEEYASFATIPPLSPIPLWEEDSSDEESEGEGNLALTEELELPPNMDTPFEWEASTIG
jgi:hypothetical protein